MERLHDCVLPGISFQNLHAQWLHTGCLKLATVGVFTLRELANTTRQGGFCLVFVLEAGGEWFTMPPLFQPLRSLGSSEGGWESEQPQSWVGSPGPGVPMGLSSQLRPSHGRGQSSMIENDIWQDKLSMNHQIHLHEWHLARWWHESSRPGAWHLGHLGKNGQRSRHILS